MHRCPHSQPVIAGPLQRCTAHVSHPHPATPGRPCRQVLAGGAGRALVGWPQPHAPRDVAAALLRLDWHRVAAPRPLLVPLPHGGRGAGRLGGQGVTAGPVAMERVGWSGLARAAPGGSAFYEPWLLVGTGLALGPGLPPQHPGCTRPLYSLLPMALQVYLLTAYRLPPTAYFICIVYCLLRCRSTCPCPTCTAGAARASPPP